MSFLSLGESLAHAFEKKKKRERGVRKHDLDIQRLHVPGHLLSSRPIYVYIGFFPPFALKNYSVQSVEPATFRVCIRAADINTWLAPITPSMNLG